MNQILVTGANGFIGKFLCRELVNKKKKVIGVIRNKLTKKKDKENDIEHHPIGNINFQTNWANLLPNIDCIVHCAGITHIPNHKNSNINYIKEINAVNVESTKKLAIQAAQAGVKRIVFLSSIKVNGESTVNSKFGKISHNEKEVFTFSDKPSPKNLYALSKLQAEQELLEVSNKTNLEVVILRLPLVYGKGVKGNLHRLLNLVRLGIPLPFSIIKNMRSIIGIDNLVDLLIRCIDHPEASGKTFLASDGEDLSTPELIKLITSSMGRKANLFPLPIFMLKFLGSVFGRREEINRLVGSLRIDNSYTKEILNWTPPVSVEEGIRRMVQGK